ncbi:hypothetical protein IGI04_022713 [Brassica rapa subsp. trilocularis]|uniref:Transmembrane protein n=1 Tax=Brassica rapa subsp. trilocularis TaxID=1813537 RepID=A0ABQ7M346_BRACM|nr:hypothetical protein IGI04_022713 [Brassica rapa subsp. trilocularis]
MMKTLTFDAAENFRKGVQGSLLGFWIHFSYRRQHLGSNPVEEIDSKLAVLVFFATPASSSSSLLPLSPILLLSIYSDMLFSSGLLRLAGDLTTARRASVNPLEEKRDLGVHGLSETESVAASPGAFLTVLQTLCRRFAILCSVYGAFGSGELLLFADRQGILGCPVVKPPWRLESLTFAVALALPTWSVAGLCRFPTACFHTVKLKSLSRLVVVGIPGVGSVVWADAELGHLFRLMRLQPSAQGALWLSVFFET